MSDKREFSELYDKFDDVYNRVTVGRRDMKSFHDLVVGVASAQERYARDLETLLKKCPAPTLKDTSTESSNEVKELIGSISTVFHSSATQMKEVGLEIDRQIKEMKNQKTKLQDSYVKVVKDMDNKKQTHTKCKHAYEDAVKKAEASVFAFRSGCNGGNEKAVRKLEEAVTSAKTNLDKCHTTYLKSVRDCQAAQAKCEMDTSVMLSQFEDLETKRLHSYNGVLRDVANNHSSITKIMTSGRDKLDQSCSLLDTDKDILAFILETYTGVAPEPHVSYEPRNTEIIPHLGDQNAISESQAHQAKQSVVHAHMTRNSNRPVQQLHINKPGGAMNTNASTYREESMNANDFFGENNNKTATAAAAVIPASSKQLQAEALYDFVGEEQGDLTIHVGDIVTLISCDDAEEWWHGSLNGVVGTFPKNFVEILSAPDNDTANELYPQQQQQQYNNTAAKTSAEPDVFHADIFATPAVAEPEPSVPVGDLKKARALYPFEGQSDDELTFNVGDILYVSLEIDGWYQGEDANGRQGIFPANYVELV